MSSKRRSRVVFRSCLPALAVLAALLGPGSSEAYTPSVARSGVITVWDLRSFAANVQNDRVSFHPHPAGTKDVLGSPIDMDEFEAIRRSYQTWEDVETSVMKFWEDPFRTAEHHNVQDRVNLVQFVKEELDPFILGVTYPYEEDDKLVDCDIILNDDFDWSTTTPGRLNHPDIQSVLTHEIGHFLGLDHAPIGQSTMYYAYHPGSIATRTLEIDDIAGLSALYPTRNIDEVFRHLVGRVDVEGQSDDRGIQVVAIDVATLLPVCAGLTRPDGSYDFLVPPGFYRIVATPARPRSSLNDYWSSADDNVLPSPLTEEGSAIGLATVVKVTAPGETRVRDLTVRRESSPLEDDDESGRATPIRIGDMAAARFEANKNDDWFSFEGRKSDVVTIAVHADQIGSGSDPELYLLDTDASTVLAKNIDIRSRLFPANEFGEAGIDPDCRLDGIMLPRDGRFFIRVRPAAHAETGGKGDYYVLLLTSGRDAPSSLTSQVAVSPGRLRADGSSTAVVTIVPKNLMGELLGPGLLVTIQHDGVGTLSAVSDHGNGIYSAVLIAPATAGEDRLDVTAQGGGGTLVLPDAARVVYVGPPDGEASEIRAEPRRLPADGSSTTTITVVPRDARGEAVGAGVAVSVEFVGATAGALDPVVAFPSGAYTATLHAPSAETDVLLRAVLDGTETTRTVRVAFGFGLASVTRDALIEIAGIAEDPQVPGKAAKKLLKAVAALRAADATLRDPRALLPAVTEALREIADAMASVVKARKKAGDPELAPVATELLEAMRDTADEQTAPSGKARDRWTRADSSAKAGDVAGAASGFAKAYRTAIKEIDPTRIRRAEVVLERSDGGVQLVARLASGKLRSARLEGPLELDLPGDGKQDGSRIYASSSGALTAGDYELVVEPKASGANQIVPFTVDGDAPAMPSVLSPRNGETGVSLAPRLLWTEVAGAERYAVLVTDRRGRVVYADTLPPGATEVWIPRALSLDPGSSYTLEVRAIAADGDRSVVRTTFTTGSG